MTGTVELLSSWNQHETLIQVVRSVTTFILAATIKVAPHLMSARTLETSRIVLLPSQDLRSVFNSDVRFARPIVTELVQRYRVASKSQKNLKLRT